MKHKLLLCLTLLSILSIFYYSIMFISIFFDYNNNICFYIVDAG